MAKTMIAREKLHEKEVSILDVATIHCRAVIEHFERMGADIVDDFFIDRLGKAKAWQSPSVWSADSFFEGNQVYPDESRVDRIRYNYLFASTPFQFFTCFNNALNTTVEAFSAQLYYLDTRIEPADVPEIASGWMKDLRSELAEEPGEESLAMLIQELHD